jgi:membrane protein YqaA with SNARE-associated domain
MKRTAPSADPTAPGKPTGIRRSACLCILRILKWPYLLVLRKLKSLYLWVLHWADTPYGTPALFLLAFAESSFFPIPPDVLQIALSMSKPRRSFYYAAISGVGSVLGGILGWFIGYALWSALGDFFTTYVPGCSPENIHYVGGLYRDNAFLAIFGAAFSPIPYKVFTISAGIFHEYVALGVLIVASALGRFARFFAVATCIFLFGPGIKRLLDKYFELATILFFILLVGGFLLIKWLL